MKSALSYSRAFGLVLAVIFTLLFMFFYGGTSIISLYIPWRIQPAIVGENVVPLLASWSIIYLSMPFMLFLAIAKLDWPAQWQLFVILTLQLLIGCVFFIILPVETTFNDNQPNGWAVPWFELATTLSMPRNHLPSLHVSFTLTAAIALQPVLIKTARIFVYFWAMLIVVSTLLIHEHHLLDIVTGALLAWGTWKYFSPWAVQSNTLQRVRLEWLWWCHQWGFAQRHRRYALISLMILSYRLCRWQKATLLTSGYVLLQTVDDIMDGDRNYHISPSTMARSLIHAWHRHRFDVNDDLMLMAADTQQRLLKLTQSREALANIEALISIMHQDYLRAQDRTVLTQVQLNKHHRATFALSLDLLLAALESKTRAKDMPVLTSLLSWCSVMRDLREDIKVGIINIPQSIYPYLNALPPDKTVTDQWLQQPLLQQWMREQHRHASEQLKAMNTSLADAAFDKSGQRIATIFTQSVDKFALKRFYQLYPWLR